jgi:alpha-tubulin suppressor-like RCC1 family protein
MLQPATDSTAEPIYSNAGTQADTCAVFFKFTGSDPDGVDDTLTYNLKIAKNGGEPQQIYQGCDTAFFPAAFERQTRYQWRLTATDRSGQQSQCTGAFTTSFCAWQAAASSHSLLLKNDGTLWAWGYNGSGQLGNGWISDAPLGGGTPPDRTSPIQIMTNVKAIAAGSNHSLILKTDGTLLACGSGNLGNGTFTQTQTSPIQIMTNVKAIAAGQNHSLILKTDGTLWACGSNEYGQLGDGNTDNRTTPTQIMANVEAIAAGCGYSLILRTDATLWACGNNNFGQLGDGTTTNRTTPTQIMTNVKAIAAGYVHSLIVKTDGTLLACGNNSFGQLGDGTTTNRTTPTRIMTNVITIATGGGHSLIIKNDGTFWVCGQNAYGQLGDGTTTNRSTPVQIRF